MLSIVTILIASTSQAIIEDVLKAIKEIGIQNKTFTALTHDELQNKLNNYKPTFLLIEGTFYRDETPQEMRHILKKYRRLQAVAFGFYEYTDKFLKMFFRAGVQGYLDMRKGHDSFKTELKHSLDGNKLIPPQCKTISYKYYLPDTTKLTNRDMEIIHLMLKGLDNNKIAVTLDIKLQSVKNRRDTIYHKLQVTNIVGLIKQLLRKGLIDLNDFMAS